jgi:hypothetical protein
MDSLHSDIFEVSCLDEFSRQVLRHDVPEDSASISVIDSESVEIRLIEDGDNLFA